MTDQTTGQILHMGLDSLVDDAKASEDYSKQVEQLLTTKISQLFSQNRVDEAVEEILPLEKKCRQVSDAISCSKLCVKIVSMYYEKQDWAKTREMMVVLSRKRGQLRRVVSDLVGKGMEWLTLLEQQAKKELHTQLLKTLLDITDGKIFVEVERSRLVSIQARILEDEQGDVEKAAFLLQEVQVETFSSMDKIEKAKFILNQMRLMLLRKDYVRVQIASRKISEKFLEDEDMQAIKIEYLNYMVEYYLHGEGSDGNYLEVAKCYKKMFDTMICKDLEVSEEKVKGKFPMPSWREAFSHWLIYLCLGKSNEKRSELMDTTLALPRKTLEAFEDMSGLVKSLQDKKLIHWPFKFEGDLEKHKVFAAPTDGAARMQILRKRIIQHNLKIVSLYYSRITTDRLMELLCLSQKEVESELSSLVTDGTLYARIDRPARLIFFGRGKKSELEMNAWSSSIEGVLDLVKEGVHLIAKEKMICEARAKTLKTKG